MGIGAGVDELGIDPDAIVDSLDTAFQDVGDAQLLPDLAQVAFPNSLVLHHAGAADHFEVRDFRQIGEDLILDAIGKEGGLLIRAQVFEGEDCDAFRGSGCGKAGGWRRGILSRFRGNRREKDPIADGQRHRRKEKDRQQGVPRGQGTQPNAGVGGAPSRGFAFELLGQRRVPDFIGVEVNNRNNYAVLHFAFAEVVQVRLPVPVLRQIFRHAFREKNVSGIAAIHHALGHVHASPGHVGPVVHIGHPTHGSAMDAHPHFEFRMTPQRLAGLHRASDWRIRSGGKSERHSVSGRQPDQFSGRFRGAESIGVADDLIELVQRLVLLINQQFRVADNVYEQDVSDFEFEIGIEFRRHRAAAHRVRCEKTACFERKLLPRQSRLFLRFAGDESFRSLLAKAFGVRLRNRPRSSTDRTRVSIFAILLAPNRAGGVEASS